eukprot:UN02057
MPSTVLMQESPFSSSWNCPFCGFINNFFNASECLSSFVVRADEKEVEFAKLRISRVMVSYLISYQVVALNANTILLMAISNDIATPKLAHDDLFGKFGDIKLLRIERNRNNFKKRNKYKSKSKPLMATPPIINAKIEYHSPKSVQLIMKLYNRINSCVC